MSTLSIDRHDLALLDALQRSGDATNATLTLPTNANLGGATLALGSWAFMFAVFGGAYALAYFVRRLWT